MSEIETKNAVIESTFLGVEDHGFFTFILNLDYGGSGQGAGLLALDDYRKADDKRVGTAAGMDLIMRVLETVGVHSWEELKGRHLRVRASHDKVYAIGHIIKDRWLDFAEHFKRWER